MWADFLSHFAEDPNPEEYFNDDKPDHQHHVDFQHNEWREEEKGEGKYEEERKDGGSGGTYHQNQAIDKDLNFNSDKEEEEEIEDNILSKK